MKNYEHQERVFKLSKDLQDFAIFWEQGTGKTKLALDTACHLRRKGEINALFILAPNGVQRAWIEDEVPKWVDVDHAAVFHTTSKMHTLRGKRELTDVMVHDFPIVAMSYDGIMTKKGSQYIAKLLRTHDAMFVCDESTAIKSASAKRTIRVLAAGKWAKYRRIMNGTPIPNSPFDLYSQVNFLIPNFWRERGFANSAVFKNYFGIWETGTYKEPKVTKSGKVLTEFKFVKGYRNLTELNGYLTSISDRVLKADVLDLPPKVYSKRYFELSAAQKKAYREIRDDALTFIATGELLTAPLAITKLLRLQQVTCNYLPSEAQERMVDISPTNPRLNCLETLLEEVSHGCIIWARFRRDIDLITNLLGDRCVRYDGQTGEEERATAKRRFQSGDVQFFVGNPAAAGFGLTLTAARTVVYYNNDFRLVNRLQSEDRAHRIGQEHPVDYVDIVCPGTVDSHIVKALRNKVEIAAAVTGDKLKEWL